MPRELGGGGAEVAELADMLRILAHSCSSTALAFSMHTHQVAIPAWRWRHQKVAAVEPLLKRVANEKHHPAVQRRLRLDRRLRQGREGRRRLPRFRPARCSPPAREAGDMLMTGAVVAADGEPDSVIHFGCR